MAPFLTAMPDFARKPFKRARSSMSSLRPPAPRFQHRRNDLDQPSEADLDLELSFASNVSLHSPPREFHMVLTPDAEYDHSAMDISPCPPPKPVVSSKPLFGRPRAYTSSARLFGRDMSNDDVSDIHGSLAPTSKSATPPTAPGTSSSNSISGSKRTQRAALPTQWFNPVEPKFPAPLVSPISEDVDAMDVDSDHGHPSHPSAAPATSSGFNNLFFESMSPRRSLEESISFSSAPKKKPRRSLSPDSLSSIRGSSRAADDRFQERSSSPAHDSSPLDRKLQRQASGSLLARFNSAANGTKPMLQGLGAPSSNILKRPRRPALSAMVNPSDVVHHTTSAFPILPSAAQSDETPSEDASFTHLKRLPTRRAFSALLPPTSITGFKVHDPFASDDSSFDASMDASSPAQAYAKRQHVKTIRRCDGTEDFRPLTGVSALVQQERSGAKSSRANESIEMSPASKLMLNAGLPGFGDNESSGKVLPCHRVREDGLMRIKVQTLNDLLDGKYSSTIKDFYVIDCRFDYEYAGGHVPGAINVRSTTGLEELLLGNSLSKPRPSVSGDTEFKTILVFHCEFSAKRAPTFAKHLRSKDRAMNGHVYPKIHYPEVYILEGGYCQYFKQSALRCDPPHYVRMDDPEYAGTCKTEMDMFRKGNGKEGVGKPSGLTRTKFGRHRSYAYGELGAAAPVTTTTTTFTGTSSTMADIQQKKRNTAPGGVGGGSLFAAANAARTRRSGTIYEGGLKALQEHDSSNRGETTDEETDIGDSPCPPSNKASGLFKVKHRLSSMDTGKAPMIRAETYGPARMAY